MRMSSAGKIPSGPPTPRSCQIRCRSDQTRRNAVTARRMEFCHPMTYRALADAELLERQA